MKPAKAYNLLDQPKEDTMPYGGDGPDPMELELMEIGRDWYLTIKNPILLGTRTEPGNDWETELKALVDDELALVDSGQASGINNAVYNVTDYSMPSGNKVDGELMIAWITKTGSKGNFAVPANIDTVEFVQRKATARMKITWNAGVDPADYDGVCLPVAGYERDNQFEEKHRFSVQETSVGKIT